MESTTGRQARRPRDTSARASARGRDATTSRDDDYDLLTAALIGVAIGIGTTLLLRSGPSGASPAGHVLRTAGRAGRGLLPRRASRLERMHRAATKQLSHYSESARERLERMAETELAALRKAIRRRRRALGL